MELANSFLRHARSGNLEKMLELLENGLVEIDTSNPNGLNGLHLACKEGHQHIVNELIARHMPVDKPTKKGNTPLHIASMAGHDNIVRVLVQAGADVNAQSQTGFTPLYMAAQENNVEVVKYLLNHSASQSIANEDGFTALSVALQQGHDSVVKLLMEEDPKTKVKLPVLHAVAKKDDLQAAHLLLQKEPLKDDMPAVNETTKNGFTPLHIAAHYGSLQVGKLLLQNNADVNFKAKNCITPLHVACKWGKGDMVNLLLDYDADIESKTRDSLTPLHCACRSGHVAVVAILVNRGSPIHTKTKSGLTALHMATQGDHVDCAEFLLTKGALIDDTTTDSLTPLHVASHCGNVRIVKFLLDDKCHTNARAMNGFTSLHVACKKNRMKVVELLLKYEADISAVTESGLTPLHISCFMGHIGIVTYLLQRNANTEIKTIRGETPLHLAARSNQLEAMGLLLENGAVVDAQAKEGQTPLHVSTRIGSDKGVEMLLQNGSNCDQVTKDLYTPLHIAVREGHVNIVALLLAAGATQDITTKKGFTPLHIASKCGSVEIANLLLEMEVNIDSEGKNGLTPLHVATHYNCIDVTSLLLEKGASPHSEAKNGYTPLHIAAKRNQMEIAELLLLHGAKPDAESRNGFTPLHLASQEGHGDLAEMLLAKGAKVSCRSRNQLCPMHLAAQEDQVKVASVLIKHESLVDPQTKAGYTPLHTACHFGQLNMVRFLLSFGASVITSTKMGYTPLHQACQQGHVLIINTLLSHHASPDSLTSDGQTPLSIAEHQGYVSAVEALKPVTTVEAEHKRHSTYKAPSPEVMMEAPIDSEDENDITLLADKSYTYLNVDDKRDMTYNSSSPDKADTDAHSTAHSNYSLQESIRDDDIDKKHALVAIQEDVRLAEAKAKMCEEDALYEFANLTKQSFIGELPVLSTVSNQENVNTKKPDIRVTMLMEEPQQAQQLKPDQLDHLKSVVVGSDVPDNTLFEELVFPGLNAFNKSLALETAPSLTFSEMSNSEFNPDNISLDRQPLSSGFLVSFMVDARGGVMSGCRHSGLRVIVPPSKVNQPTRITCKLVAMDKLPSPLLLNDGDSLATRILQLGPAGIKFSGPVLLELPHFASLRGGERELSTMRSMDGLSWKEHNLVASDDQVTDTLLACNFDEDLEPAEKLFNNRHVVRIITTDFPRYVAIVTRYALESRLIGHDGGVINSKVIPQVKAEFPKNCVQNRKIPISLQAMRMDGQLVSSIFGQGVTVSPITTIEPRHRKFHHPIQVTLPLPPQSSLKHLRGRLDHTVLNKLRLLCCMAGGGERGLWTDVTGSSDISINNACATFSTNISARFWLLEIVSGPVTAANMMPMVQRLYEESLRCPYLGKFVVYAKRRSLTEGRLRALCTTDDTLEKSLEASQHFVEVARGKDVEVFEGAQMNLALIGNLAVSQAGRQNTCHKYTTTFRPFQENRLQSLIRLRDLKEEPSGQLLIIPSPPRLIRGKDGRCVNPICALNLCLPSNFSADPLPEHQQLQLLEVFQKSLAAADKLAKAEMKLTDIADALQSDWVLFARQLHFSQDDIVAIQREYVFVNEQALVILHKWSERMGGTGTGNELEKVLRKIGRLDIIEKCMRNVVEVTDEWEKEEAMHCIENGDVHNGASSGIINNNYDLNNNSPNNNLNNDNNDTNGHMYGDTTSFNSQQNINKFMKGSR